jgi:uncharacterized protein (DUF924 family)
MPQPVDIGQAERLLAFWFGPPGSPERGRPREIWFEPEPGFDAALRRDFLGEHERAAAGGLAEWQAAPEPCLALILLLDQLPRNLFRGSARAYACDPRALQVARHALDADFDRRLPPVWRWFVYLPFEHSEALADQETSLRLHASLPEHADHAATLASARRHHEIIARFGRFPHRNAILGRVSTPEEEEFLRQPDSSF